MFLAFFQMIAIGWFYGSSRLCKNVKQMTGKTPSIYFRSCWTVAGPLLLFVSRRIVVWLSRMSLWLCSPPQSLWIFSLINYKKPTYHNGHYEYPEWAHALGWCITAVSLVCIPGYAIISILRAEGETFLEVMGINFVWGGNLNFSGFLLPSRNSRTRSSQTSTSAKYVGNTTANTISPMNTLCKRWRQSSSRLRFRLLCGHRNSKELTWDLHIRRVVEQEGGLICTWAKVLWRQRTRTKITDDAEEGGWWIRKSQDQT